MNMALATMSETVRALARGGSGAGSMAGNDSQSRAGRYNAICSSSMRGNSLVPNDSLRVTMSSNSAASSARRQGTVSLRSLWRTNWKLVPMIACPRRQRAPSCRSSRRACGRHGRCGTRSCRGHRRSACHDTPRPAANNADRGRSRCRRRRRSPHGQSRAYRRTPPCAGPNGSEATTMSACARSDAMSSMKRRR